MLYWITSFLFLLLLLLSFIYLVFRFSLFFRSSLRPSYLLKSLDHVETVKVSVITPNYQSHGVLFQETLYTENFNEKFIEHILIIANQMFNSRDWYAPLNDEEVVYSLFLILTWKSLSKCINIFIPVIAALRMNRSLLPSCHLNNWLTRESNFHLEFQMRRRKKGEMKIYNSMLQSMVYARGCHNFSIYIASVLLVK